MSPDKFLIHFYKIADAPNGVQRLREMILQLAVQGKLVAQDEADEPASVLLEKIQAEKERLIQEGKIKRQKPLPAITEEEKPFALPKGWEWVRLNDIGFDWGQVTPQSTFTYIDVASINNQKGFIQSPSVVEAENAPSRARKVIKKNTVIYSTIRPYLLNVCVVEKDYTPQAIASTAFAIIHPFKGILSSYIKAYLRSPAFIKYVEAIQVGVAYPAINDKQFFSGLFPIAPEKEQIRILAKVDSLLSLCDQLEALQSQRTQLNHSTRQAVLDQLSNAQSPLDLHKAWQRLQTHLPRLFTEPQHIKGLRDAILQLAVQGRLVPQDENDEPASVLLAKIQAEKERLIQAGKIKRQKPLPAITEEEKPFELPKGWEWVRFDDLALHSEAGWSPTCETQPRDRNKWGILKVSAVTWGKFKPEENKELPANLEPRPEYEVKAGDFLISRANTAELVARAVIVPKDAPERLMLSDKIIRFVFASDVNKHFINLVNNSGFARTYYAAVAGGTSSSMKNVSREQIRKLAFALPPEKEILSILKKYSALNNLCDQLESKLTQARQTQEQFALTATAMSKPC
ncbi:hypothetical protein [uncultured Thiothrix sp.]|uniref:restriction endonuclease subunit S n=1 Tax=uncultured Thiothrix sp. TaxID=223185 RepID=UPI002613BD6C|nr:hypothetical protein [uncultured Thiothrix sp.]